MNPPPLAWLATPFIALPFEAAIFVWTLLVVGAALFAWWVVAPGSRLARLSHLALFLGLFPTAFGLMVGQPVALVAAAVAGSWWLAERNKPVLAGLVMSLTAIKPQVALLIPVLAGLLGIANGVRMRRLPDPAPSSAPEGTLLG